MIKLRMIIWNERNDLMSVYTLLVDQKTLDTMADFYQDYTVKTPSHAKFQAKITGCTITAYNSKKVVFQGKNAEQEITLWQALQQPVKQMKTKQVPHLTHFDNFDCIGCDESGVGDYFGPLTAACVYVPKQQTDKLKQLGIMDSKQMTDEYICKIAPTIMESCYHAITILPNEKYNQLQAKGINGHMMKALLHNQALQKLLNDQTFTFDYIIMDQFVNESTYYRYFKTLQISPITGLTFIPKAEGHSIAVAAASVLARYTYVKAMDKLASKYGKTLPKGASKTVDHFAAEIIHTHGESCLQIYAKVHFATTQKALELLK